MLTKNLKEFLEKNIELIEENKFDELYKKAENDLYFFSRYWYVNKNVTNS